MFSWFISKKTPKYSGVVESVDYDPITGGRLTISLDAYNNHKDINQGDFKKGQEISLEIT